MLFKRGDREKRGFSPIYLAILSAIIHVILTITGFMEINRTRRGDSISCFRERQSSSFSTSRKIFRRPWVSSSSVEEKAGTPVLTPSDSGFYYGLEESAGEYLVEAAIYVDQLESKAKGSSEYMTIEMGAPDLSNYSSSPEVLFIRLKDPAARRSDTKMPNLEPKETEIEALIAFINSK